MLGINELVGSERPADNDSLLSLIGGHNDDWLAVGYYQGTDELVSACIRNSVTVITLTRDPYAQFGAAYLTANGKAAQKTHHPALKSLAGLSFTSPELFDFIRDDFSHWLATAATWLKTGQTLVLRFEDDLSEFVSTLDQERGADEVHNDFIARGAALSSAMLPAEVVEAIAHVVPQEYVQVGYRRESRGAMVSERAMSQFSSFQIQFATAKRVFLVGYGKSGTTWLHMLFFHHPNVAATAERRLFEHPDNNEALLDPLLDDVWFQSWFKSSSFGIVNPQADQIRYELARVMSDYLTFRQLSLRNNPKGFNRAEPITHFTEKVALNTPADATATIANLKRLYPEAKIIHIVRDPRDIAVSALFHSYRNFTAANESNWLTSYIDCVMNNKKVTLFADLHRKAFYEDQAKSWNEIAKIFHEQGQSLYQDNYHLVRYEDMLGDPLAEVTQMFGFVGLQTGNGLAEQAIEKASFKSLSQGRKTGEQDKTSFFRKGISGDWKNYLSDKESITYFKEARPLMLEFGYLTQQ